MYCETSGSIHGIERNRKNSGISKHVCWICYVGGWASVPKIPDSVYDGANARGYICKINRKWETAIVRCHRKFRKRRTDGDIIALHQGSYTAMIIGNGERNGLNSIGSVGMNRILR